MQKLSLTRRLKCGPSTMPYKTERPYAETESDTAFEVRPFDFAYQTVRPCAECEFDTANLHLY